MSAAAGYTGPWTRMDAAHWAAAQDLTAFTEWRAIGKKGGLPLVLVVNDGMLSEAEFEATSCMVEAAPCLLEAARLGLKTARRELYDLLASVCLLDDDLEPRRDTISAEFAPVAQTMEAEIAAMEAAIIAAGQVPA